MHDITGPTSQQELARILASPEYQEQQAERRATMAAREAQFAAIEAPLIAELREAGFDVPSVWSLRQLSEPYPVALPILLRHFAQGYPPQISGGIGRALAVKYAAPFWSEIVALYRQAPDDDGRQGLAVAIARIVKEAQLSEYVDLVSDPSNGESRVLLVRRLKSFKNPRGLETLKALTADRVLGQEAQRALAGKSPNS